MEFNSLYISQLQTELLRVTTIGRFASKFTTQDGEIQGATESDVIKHLTSSRDYVEGREVRFPGIGNGWRFNGAIEATGFRLVRATNNRGQSCRVITL